MLGWRQRGRLCVLDDPVRFLLGLGDHTPGGDCLAGLCRLDLGQEFLTLGAQRSDASFELLWCGLGGSEGVGELGNLAGQPVPLLDEGSRIPAVGDDRRNLRRPPVGVGDDLGGAALSLCDPGCRHLVTSAGCDGAGLDGGGTLSRLVLDLLRLRSGAFEDPILGIEDGEHGLVDLFLRARIFGEGELCLGLVCPRLEFAKIRLELRQVGLDFLLVVSLSGGRELALIQSGGQLG